VSCFPRSPTIMVHGNISHNKPMQSDAGYAAPLLRVLLWGTQIDGDARFE
jgi:hypothetical protein